MRLWLLGVVALAGGILLVNEAFGTFRSRLAALEGDSALALIEAGVDVSASGLDRLVSSRLRAMSWRPFPSYWRDIGLARSNFVADPEDPSQRSLKVEASRAFRRALAGRRCGRTC